jgi:hypothetical protein
MIICCCCCRSAPSLAYSLSHPLLCSLCIHYYKIRLLSPSQHKQWTAWSSSVELCEFRSTVVSGNPVCSTSSEEASSDLSHTVTHCILYYTILYYTILYYTNLLSYPILYYTAYTILPILCYTILYVCKWRYGRYGH